MVESKSHIVRKRESREFLKIESSAGAAHAFFISLQ